MNKIILSTLLLLTSMQVSIAADVANNDCNPNSPSETTEGMQSMLQLMREAMQKEDLVISNKLPKEQVLPQYECVDKDDKEGDTTDGNEPDNAEINNQGE